MSISTHEVTEPDETLEEGKVAQTKPARKCSCERLCVAGIPMICERFASPQTTKPKKIRDNLPWCVLPQLDTRLLNPTSARKFLPKRRQTAQITSFNQRAPQRLGGECLSTKPAMRCSPPLWHRCHSSVALVSWRHGNQPMRTADVNVVFAAWWYMLVDDQQLMLLLVAHVWSYYYSHCCYSQWPCNCCAYWCSWHSSCCCCFIIIIGLVGWCPHN